MENDSSKSTVQDIDLNIFDKATNFVNNSVLYIDVISKHGADIFDFNKYHHNISFGKVTFLYLSHKYLSVKDGIKAKDI